jgi:phospholipase C
VTVESNLTFERRLAGHVETGRDSMSDPAIGAPGISTIE